MSDRLPPARSSAAPNTSGDTNPAPNPSVECTAIVAPFRRGSAAPTMPAVSVEESLITSAMCATTRATTTIHGAAAAKPSAQVSAPESIIPATMTGPRPMRSAASLPTMLAAGEPRLASAWIAAGDSGAGTSVCAKVRKATIHEREPKSSQQCTA